jgi:hypothetical protein
MLDAALADMCDGLDELDEDRIGEMDGFGTEP